MSLETAAQMETKLEELGELLQVQLNERNYEAARHTLRGMKFMANGCKLRLVGAFLRMSRKTVTRSGLEKMEQNGAKAIEIVLKQEEYTARAGMLARGLGKFGARFLGAAGAILIVKDILDGGLYVADSMAEQVALNRMSHYGDYMNEVEASGDSAHVKTYKQWLASDYFPGQHQKSSEFFQHIKTLFPYALPV